MARYIPAKRIRSTTSDADRLRDQFIRQLTQEAQATLRRMTEQFNQNLERQSSEFMSGLLGDGSGSGNASGSAFGMFSTAARYLFNRPRITESTRESTRSSQEERYFRVSQSQLMAEAAEALSKGDKNA